jgi:hypothetical protein
MKANTTPEKVKKVLMAILKLSKMLGLVLSKPS